MTNLTAKVWPSTGQPRKWFIQNPDEISVYGSFSYLDEYSTKPDCVHADGEMFHRTFEGWRDATDSERDEVIFQLDQDDLDHL